MTVKEFFESFDIPLLVDEVKRSLVSEQFPQEFRFKGEDINFYLNSRDYQKYFVPDYEMLGLLALQLFKSGRGFYIVSYAHEYGINRYVTGFQTKEELIHYLNYVLGRGVECLNQLQEKVYRLKDVEDQMSQIEILTKNMDYLETQQKILERLFDPAAKAPYCEKLTTLETVQTTLNHLIENYQLLHPIYQELVNLGELRACE